MLQSACYAGLADMSTLEAVLLRSRPQERLQEPRSSSRRAIRARCSCRAMAGPGACQARLAEQQQRASRNCKLAAQLFEPSSATSIDAPGWGHAEAYLAFGRELQARGDQLGARNWIEKSLIAAPDYKAAQRQLAHWCGAEP